MALVITGDPGDRPVVSDIHFLAEQDKAKICRFFPNEVSCS